MDQQNSVGLQAPWVTLLGQLQAMFEQDAEVEVSTPDITETKPFTINIDTINCVKCDALKRVLKTHYQMGNIEVVINIRVIDTDEPSAEPTLEDFNNAFSGNPLFVATASVETPVGTSVDYVIFAKEIIQFYNDNISDIYGNFNGIVANVAEEICNHANINFSTSNGSEEAPAEEEE